MNDTSFEEQTDAIRRWVNNESVATEVLASELLAWTDYVLQGFSLRYQADCRRKAADRLDELAALR